MRGLLFAVAVGAALTVVAVPGVGGAAAVLPCRGGDLRATFTLVPGSPGAGNVVYTLRVRDVGRTCFVTGLPQVTLLTRTGKALPTHVVAARPGLLTAVRVVLRPGRYAAATARFSPDVPGPGETAPGSCEPRATKLRVTSGPGLGATVGPIRPTTSVCSHGAMSFTGFVAGKTGPPLA